MPDTGVKVKIGGLLLLFMHACLMCFAQQPDTLSLQQCIQNAIDNNLGVKQSALQMQSADVGFRQAKDNLLPALFGEAVHGVNDGRSIDPYTNTYINQQVNFATYGASANLILFSGLGLQNSIKQYKLAYQASEQNLQQSKDNLIIRVIVEYLQVLTEEDLLQSAQDQSDVTDQQVQRLDKLNQEGAITPSLLYDLKGQFGNDQLTIINTKNDLAQAKLNLAQLMNLPYDDHFEIQPINAEELLSQYNLTQDQIYQSALQNYAQVKAVDFQYRSTQYEVKAAKANFYPTLSLSGSVNTNYSNAATLEQLQSTADLPNGDYVMLDGAKVPVISQQQNFTQENISFGNQVKNNIYSSLSLNLSIPILNSFTAKHRTELAKIDEENALAVAQSTKIQLKLEIDQAYSNMKSAYDRYVTLTDQVNSFGESFREAQVRFNNGSINSVDYLVAKNNVDVARNNFIISKYDYILRTKILDYYQGKMSWQ